MAYKECIKLIEDDFNKGLIDEDEMNRRIYTLNERALEYWYDSDYSDEKE